MSTCRVNGCTEPGEHTFGLAIAANDPSIAPVATEGNICLTHANELWASLGIPKRATEIMAEELCTEINNGADAVVIRMDKRMAGL